MSEALNLVTYRKEGGVAVITLNNPPANTYSFQMMLQLDAAILEARFDADVAVIVVTGEGEKFFCTGADINMLQEVTPQFKYNFCLHANETLLRMENTAKLFVAALNGHTVGGGLEVALGCDIRLAREGAGKVGLPEVKLGVLPGTGGTQRLVRVVGKSTAIKLMTSGVLMSFEEAHKLGLVDEILPNEGFMDAVMDYATSLTPPHTASQAVGFIKRAVQTGAEIPLQEGLALERELQQQLFMSADSKEGMAAYREKRQAEFKGY
jgi:enoyl-CoA hydratase/carnithine racemase